MSESRTPKDHAVVGLIELADRAEERGDVAERHTFVQRAVELLEGAGEIDAAIDLAVSKDEPALAAQTAERAGDHRRAAQLFADAGSDVRAAAAREAAGEPDLAAGLWERAKEFAKAAAIHETQGDFVRASKLFDRAGEKKRAAELLVRALSGDGTRRLLGAEAHEACRQAGALYNEAKEIDLAVRVLRWGGQTVFAGQLLMRAERHDDAIELLYASGDLLAAAEAAREAGKEERAHLLLAERAEKDGRLKEAAAHLEEGGAHAKAGHVYELAQDPERAALAFERAGQFDTAAQLYERLGKPEHAVRCLRAAGRTSEARAVEERTSTQDASIRRYVEDGQLLRAAKATLALARAGDQERYEDAVKYLEQVSTGHEDHVAARTLLAEVLSEMGDNRRAMTVLQSLFVGVRPSVEHVPAMYQYGRLLEQEGFLAGARNAYRTAAAFEPTYRDLIQRLQRLREDDQETNESQPPTIAPPPEAVVRAVPTVPMVVGRPPIPRAVSSVEHLMPADLGLSLPAGSPTMDLIDRELRTLTGNFRVQAPADSRPGSRYTPIPDLVPSPPSPVVEQEEPEPDVLAPEDLVEVLEEHEPDARPDALVGMVLRGRFRIERKIGRGAQAEVYLARDQVLDRPVAIKVLNESVADDNAALDRFLREARLAARVHHVGCLAIYDFGQERGLTFMAMEYFRGRTLRDLVKRGPMDPYLVLRVSRDVAAALGAVHEAGIVHRDVKPTNVMIDRSGNVRLTDFGVARTANDESSSGMMVGTMKYMAPEQARGKEADHRADIFSLGVVIFEMLASSPPFGGTLDALIARVTKAPPQLDADLDVPDDLRALVQRCMQRLPDSRYATVAEVMIDIQKAIDRMKAERKKKKRKKKPRPIRTSRAKKSPDDSEDPTLDGQPAIEA